MWKGVHGWQRRSHAPDHICDALSWGNLCHGNALRIAPAWLFSSTAFVNPRKCSKRVLLRFSDTSAHGQGRSANHRMGVVLQALWASANPIARTQRHGFDAHGDAVSSRTPGAVPCGIDPARPLVFTRGICLASDLASHTVD